MRKKRIFCLCLALSMCLSLLPIQAEADEVPSSADAIQEAVALDADVLDGPTANETSEGVYPLGVSDDTPPDVTSNPQVIQPAVSFNSEAEYSVVLPVVAESDSVQETAKDAVRQDESGAFILPEQIPGLAENPNIAVLMADDDSANNYYCYYGMDSFYLNHISIPYSGDEPLENGGIFEITDGSGKILAYSDSQSYYSDGEGLYRGSANFRNVDFSDFEPNTAYPVQFAVGNSIYPCNATLTVVDSLYIQSVYIQNLFVGEDTFSVNMNLYGFRTEADLSLLRLELLDESGDVVAVSTGGYQGENAAYSSGRLTLYFQMQVESGKRITSGVNYSLRVTSTGTPIINGASTAARSASTVSAYSIIVEDAYFTETDPAVIHVELSHFLPETTYKIGVGSDYNTSDYGEYVGTVPEDGAITISVTLNGQEASASQLDYNFYVIAQYNTGYGEWYQSNSKSFQNPYYNSNDGYAYFYPSSMKPTAKSVSFSIESYLWANENYNPGNNLLELRDDKGNVVGSCSEMTLTQASGSSAMTYVTGTLNIASSTDLAEGVYDLYLNGKQFDDVRVRSNMIRSRSWSSYFNDDSFWTEFGQFSWDMEIFGGSGSGQFIFQQNGADVVSTGMIQGQETTTDTHRYMCVFSEQQMSNLHNGGVYGLIFRDSNGSEITLFYDRGNGNLREYDTVPVWPADRRDAYYIRWYDMTPGDQYVRAELYFYNDGFRNVVWNDILDEFIKYSLVNGEDTITVQNVVDVGTDESTHNYAVRLHLDTSVTAGSYQVYYDGHEQETVTVGSTSTQTPDVWTRSGSNTIFGARYLPVDKLYTGKLYKGYTCLTPDAFPLTLLGDFGTNQTLSCSKSVLDQLDLTAGTYKIWIFMDNEILDFLDISVLETQLPSISVGVYINNRYYENVPVITDGSGEFEVTPVNVGDYRYFRYADTNEGLSGATFETASGNRYYAGVLSDSVTPGPRTLYAEFSKSGSAVDAENVKTSVNIWFCPSGDYGLSVPAEIEGIQPDRDSYTLTASLEVPYANVWVGFHDANERVAYQLMTYSGEGQNGKSEFTLTIDHPEYGSFYDYRYSNEDGTGTFHYKDTRFVEFFAVDFTDEYHSDVSYRGNICSEVIERFLSFGTIDSIILPQFLKNRTLYINSDSFTLYGYSAPDDTITIEEGDRTLAAGTSNQYGYFSIELTNIVDGEHIWTVSGQSTEGSSECRLSVDANAPEISVFVFSFLEDRQNMVLRWYCEDEDIDHFELYKNGRVLLSNIPASDRSRNVVADASIFTLYAIDFAGNRASKTLTLEDTEKPVAHISPDEVQVVVNTSILFSGDSSTDNLGIASYTWDFGDGSVATTTMEASHTYAETGTYTVTLTVRDYAGLTDNTTATVTVVPEAPSTTFTILNSQTGAPVSGATVAITNSENIRTSFVSDADGKVTLILEDGQYVVSAVSGSLRRLNVNVEVSESGHDFTIGLNDDSILRVSANVNEMSLEDAQAAGIDTNAPENNHVYNCTAVFEFGSLNYIYNSEGTVLKSTPVRSENITAYAVAKDIYLIVYSQVAWLKEMFDVQLLIQNTSAFEVIEDCTANLTLPDGLSLAIMKPEVGAQSANVNLGLIESGGEKSLHWYVSGDAEGTYTINGNVTGIRVGGGVTENISTPFTTEQPIEVLAGSAMKLTIAAQRQAIVGQPYRIRYTLENVSKKTLYNVALNVLAGKFLREYSITDLSYDPDSIHEIFGTLNEGFSISDTTFEPDEKLSGVFTITFGAGLNLTNGMEYILKDMFAVTGAGSTAVVPTVFQWENSPEYGFTFQTGENGTVTADRPNAIAGETVRLTVTPNEGYTLDSLTVVGEDGTAIEVTDNSFMMPEQNVTIKVSFKELPPTEHAINLVSAAHGSLNASRTSSEPGETVSVTVTPDEGYELDVLTVVDSSGNAVQVTGTEFVMPDGDVTITATFKEILDAEYDVTVNNGDGSGRYKAGDTVHISAPASKNSQSFRDWTWNGPEGFTIPNNTSNSTTFTMPGGPVTVTANYQSQIGGCYVATAVYGSYDCPEVWTLRRFRDKVLARTWYGRLFIHLYYAVSPTAVRLFGQTQWFQDFFRSVLDLWVADLQADGFESTPYQDRAW